MSRGVSLILIFILVSCGSEPTQQERYDDVISGIPYYTYKPTARASAREAVELYNEQKPDSVAPLNIGYVHILIGYSLSIAGSNAFAFAEADMAEESPEPEIKNMAIALRAITMYEMGLDSLGRRESQSIRKNLQPNDSSANQLITFYVLMGVAKAYEGSLDESKFFLAGLANETGVHWPYQIMDAASDFKKGDVQQALQKVKVMSQDPAVPEELRKVLAENIEEIEKNTGDVNSPLFWPRLISKAAYAQFKKSMGEQMEKVVQADEK